MNPQKGTTMEPMGRLYGLALRVWVSLFTLRASERREFRLYG